MQTPFGIRVLRGLRFFCPSRNSLFEQSSNLFLDTFERSICSLNVHDDHKIERIA
jgi:hypothetical protein